jgi:hypothetical protein
VVFESHSPGYSNGFRKSTPSLIAGEYVYDGDGGTGMSGLVHLPPRLP